MASTGGGAARSSKKRNPDVAGQDEDSSTDVVVGDNMERIERKIDILVSSIASLVGTVNSLVDNVKVKEEKSKPTADRSPTDNTRKT